MVEVDADGAREVGAKYFPALADVYKDVSESWWEGRETVETANQGKLEVSVKNYLTTLTNFVNYSDWHLRDCGDALVDFSDSLKDVDEENADSIANPVEGMPEDD